MEKIMCSAIWVKNVNSTCHKPKNIDNGIVVCGYRHCDCIGLLSTIYDRGTIIKFDKVQGFLTTNNRFVNRIEAKQIAINANQLLERECGKDELFSEDVW